MVLTTKPKHILRYGTNAEQKYIDKLKNCFDLLTINGNMLAHTPGAIASFIMMLISETKTVKGYFIDPITHAFQHDVSTIMSYSKKEEKLVIKKSVRNLIDYYGEPIKTIINSGNSILPSNFDTKEIKESFTQNVIEFQLSTITSQLYEKGFLEYLQYVDDKSYLLNLLKPYLVIPPYFFLDASDPQFNNWLSLNIDFINIAKEKYPTEKVYGQLVISQNILLNEKILNKICSKYVESKPEGILLWIDNFDEHEVTTDLLTNYCNIVKCLHLNNIRVYNLYGGFFSTILTGFRDELGYELNGVGHSLEYGESRPVVPVGGGIPTNKYYYYPLHYRLDYRKATGLLNNLGYFSIDPRKGALRYYKNICSCPICRDIIRNDINNFSIFENTEFYEVVLRGSVQRRSYASQDTKEVCVLHYQYNKIKEFQEVEKRTLNDFMENFSGIIQQYSKYKDLIPEPLHSMKKWLTVITNERKR
jgi:hypothetical protein